MNRKPDLPPVITEFLDAKEEELYKAIESDDYDFGKSFLTTDRKIELQQAAKNSLHDRPIQTSQRVFT